MRKKILTLLLLAFAGAAAASAQDALVINKADLSGYALIKLSDTESIKFLNGNIVVNRTDGATMQFAFGSVMSIKFADYATGIDTPQAGGKPEISVSGNSLALKGWDTSTKADLTIYDMAGRTVASAPGYAGEQVYIGSLTPGVYIIKINSKSLKFTKQ